MLYSPQQFLDVAECSQVALGLSSGAFDLSMTDALTKVAKTEKVKNVAFMVKRWLSERLSAEQSSKMNEEGMTKSMIQMLIPYHDQGND